MSQFQGFTLGKWLIHLRKRICFMPYVMYCNYFTGDIKIFILGFSEQNCTYHPDFSSHNFVFHIVIYHFTESVLYLTHLDLSLVSFSLWPCHPRLVWKHDSASVSRVQPQSLLEDLGWQHRDTHASVPQCFLWAHHRKHHVPRWPWPP